MKKHSKVVTATLRGPRGGHIHRWTKRVSEGSSFQEAVITIARMVRDRPAVLRKEIVEGAIHACTSWKNFSDCGITLTFDIN